MAVVRVDGSKQQADSELESVGWTKG